MTDRLRSIGPWPSLLGGLLRGSAASLAAAVASAGITLVSLGVPRHEALLVGPLLCGLLLGWYLRNTLAAFFFALVPALLLAAAVGFMTALAYMSTHAVPWFDQYLFMFYGATFLTAATLAGAARQLYQLFTSPQAALTVTGTPDR